MSVLAAFMVPHPPMIVPDVGQGDEKRVQKTTDSYEMVAKRIAELKPDTIVISSPHTVMYGDYFHISPGSGAKGDFASFRAPGVKFDERYDEELVKEICRLADEEDFPELYLQACALLEDFEILKFKRKGDDSEEIIEDDALKKLKGRFGRL